MGKAARKTAVRKKATKAAMAALGPTPEQVAQQEYTLVSRSEITDVARTGSLPVKRARTIDTWRKRGIIDYRLWRVADWYEERSMMAALVPRVTGTYGQGSGGGSGFYANLPATEAIARARHDIHYAGQALRAYPRFLKIFQRVVIDNYTATDVGRHCLGVSDDEAHVRWSSGEPSSLSEEDRRKRIERATNKVAYRRGLTAWKAAANIMADWMRNELGLDAPGARV